MECNESPPLIHKQDLDFLFTPHAPHPPPFPTIQDFLRNIPGSLLCCELYEEWLEALEDEDEEEEQVQDVKRCVKTIETKKRKKKRAKTSSNF